MSQTVNQDITVVIPTLGEQFVLDTVKYLNAGTMKPGRIILCVPSDCKLDISGIDNTELIKVEGKGQVLQRAAGFRQSITPYTLQMDDDILVEARCLEHLHGSMRDSDNIAIAPAFINKQTGKSLYHLATGSLFRRFYYRLLNGRDGYREGVVTRAGTGFGIDAELSHENPIVATDWVPGGCLMHRTRNLVLDNFFPFPGKAFAEDLIHSYHLKRKGIMLKINLEARALVDPQPGMGESSFPEFLAFIKAEYRARRYYLALSKSPATRLVIYYLCQCLFYFVGKLRNAVS